MIMKNIFNGIFNESVHISFLKFGRGKYKNKYLIEGKKQTKKWAIKTGPEYSNFLVRRCLKIQGRPTNVKGVIVSTLDLKDEIPFNVNKISNFQGVRKYIISDEAQPEDVFELMDKYPKAFFALSFKGGGFDLKIKAKAPTSGKPGKEKEGGAVADFCSLKTENKEIVDELFFDVGEFTEVKVSYDIMVNDIIYPENIAELKPAEIRELAKRKGVIKRKIIVDRIEKNSEVEFVA